MATPGGRIIGVDLARLLALLGMFAAHLLLPVPGDGPGAGVDPVFQVVAGRSAALFAVLAGVSIALVTRSAVAHPGSAGGHRARLLVRAAVIAGIGLLLGLLDSGIAVILVYYAVLFCCALPVVTWGAGRLAALAGLWCVLGPGLSLLVRPALPPASYAVPSLVSLADPVRLGVELVVTGYYPVLTWATYLFAGMAIGRLDLRSRSVARRLATTGAALGTLAVVLSSLLTRSEGVRAALLASAPRAPGSWDLLSDQLRQGFYGTHPTGSPWWLAVWVPHSGSIIDLAHTTGTATLVLGVCLVLVGSLPRLPWHVLSGAGTMTLTLYTVHVVVLGSALGTGTPLARGAEGAWWWHAGAAVLLGAGLVAAGRGGPLEDAVRRACDQVPLAPGR